MHRGVVAVGMGALLIAGAGAFYATSGSTPALRSHIAAPALTPEEDWAVLENRATAYWQARVEGDLDQAFAYEDPVRQKALGKRGYKRRIDSGLEWKEVEVLGVEIWPGGELADVGLRVRYQAPIVGEVMAVTSQRTDDWQKLDGTWYHVLDLTPLPTGEKPTIPGTKPKGAQLG